MSKFNKYSSFFKRNTNQFEITIKPSKKDKKNVNNNKLNNVSDNDFIELMKENKVEKKKEIKLSDYLDKIKDSEIVEQLIQEQLIGEDLVCRIKSENITGSQLLKGILKKYNNQSNYNWIHLEQYGQSLAYLFSDNIKEQILCLLMIQDHSRYLGFPKITFKDKQVYYLKTIFQLLFTYDIIEESSFWKWQDLLIDIVDIDEDTKNKICIQTTEFFNILKMTFTDEDYEEKEEVIEENKKLNNHNSDNKPSRESDFDSEKESDKYNVPEEQDYNMDDDNFNLDDL